MDAFETALLDTPLDEVRWTVFDLETTGINPDEGDKIIEIAAVRIEEDFRLNKKQEFSSLVNPGRHIPHKNSLIHGITDEQVAKAPDFASVFYDFADFARDTVWVAHNASKDASFLRASMAEYMVKPHFPPIIDSLRLSRMFNDADRHDLTSLTEKFNLDKHIKGRQHRALPDAKRTALMFRKILKNVFPKECLFLSELMYIQQRY